MIPTTSHKPSNFVLPMASWEYLFVESLEYAFHQFFWLSNFLVQNDDDILCVLSYHGKTGFPTIMISMILLQNTIVAFGSKCPISFENLCN
jgi:hypothetical protein